MWWHNATQGPGVKLYKDIAAEFQKQHPDVTIKAVPLQNEQFKTKIPIALQSDSPPDVFQSWGGGGLVDQVKAGKVAEPHEVRQAVDQEHRRLGRGLAGERQAVRQSRTTSASSASGTTRQLFAKAGSRVAAEDVAAVPRRRREAQGRRASRRSRSAARTSGRTRSTGTTSPSKLCSKTVMQSSAVTLQLRQLRAGSKAGEYVQQLIDAEPFQNGFLATPAQQGASSSAGLVANGKAAMELQGTGIPGVMQSLTPDNKVPSFLGWFPFPNVPGSKALPGSLLGGGDGFACSWKAPQPACAQFLAYIDSPSVQRRVGSTGFGLPVRKGIGELRQGSEPQAPC